MSLKSQKSDGSVSNGSRRLVLYQEDQETDFAVRLYQLWERLEFYAFFGLGSYTWYYVVFKVLDWHRFPIHLYTFELWLVVVVPIMLMLAILYGIDYMFKEKAD